MAIFSCRGYTRCFTRGCSLVQLSFLRHIYEQRAHKSAGAFSAIALALRAFRNLFVTLGVGFSSPFAQSVEEERPIPVAPDSWREYLTYLDLAVPTSLAASTS